MIKGGKYGIKPKGRNYKTEEGMGNNRRFLGRSERFTDTERAGSRENV
jgi:hypothetical protein